MIYQTFTRTWWRDDKCTVPGAGHRVPHKCFRNEEHARAACHAFNQRLSDPHAGPQRGPRGLCMEYEVI